MKSIIRSLAFNILACIGLICCSHLAIAQSMNSADLRGSVTDATGALIPGVQVSVLNVDTGVEKIVSTNASGLYDTSSIVSGHYKVTFTKDGFETVVRGPITLQTGYTTVNTQLKVGAASISITVTTDVPLLQQDSGEETETWNAHTLDSMPQVGANYGQGQDWENEMAFLPGMSGNATSSYGVAGLGQYGSSNGSQASNNILLDGSSTSLGGSTYANLPTLKAINHLQVLFHLLRSVWTGRRGYQSDHQGWHWYVPRFGLRLHAERQAGCSTVRIQQSADCSLPALSQLRRNDRWLDHQEEDVLQL